MENNCTFEQGEVVEVSDYSDFPRDDTYEAKFIANINDELWEKLLNHNHPILVLENYIVESYKYIRKLQPKPDIITYKGEEYEVDIVEVTSGHHQEATFHCYKISK